MCGNVSANILAIFNPYKWDSSMDWCILKNQAMI